MSQRTSPWIASILLLAACLIALPAIVHADDGPATAEKAKPAAKKDAKPKRRPLLWMVEGSPRVFLYGTIHVADKRVVEHLPVVQAAFDQSTALYTELRLDAAGQMQMQMTVMQMAAMPDKTLAEVFGKELHARVAKLMPANIPFAMLQNTKPWLTQFLLLQTLMTEHAAKQKRDEAKQAKEDGKSSTDEKPANGAAAPTQALDPLLYAQAQQAGKRVGGLETIESQIKVFDDLSIEAQTNMIKELVEEIEKVKAAAAKEAAGEEDGADESEDESEEEGESHLNALTKMVDMWLAGDDQGFLDLFETDLRKTGGEEADKFVKGLLDDHNEGMAAKVLEMMKADPKQTYFIAVGAGHMPGEKGVVKLLQKQGLKVTRMELGAKIPPLPKADAKKAEAKKEPVKAGG